MPFIGGTDPDGWIICDGSTRTCTDSRFSDLSVILNTYMGVNTNNANSITPPDLRSKFIRGHGVSTTTTKATGGADTVTLSVSNMPSHNHSISISDPGHSHTISVSDSGHSHNTPYGQTNNGDWNAADGLNEFPPADDGIMTPRRTYPSDTSYANIQASCSGATTSISATSANSGSGSAVDILPSYYSMNYIMKY